MRNVLIGISGVLLILACYYGNKLEVFKDPCNIPSDLCYTDGWVMDTIIDGDRVKVRLYYYNEIILSDEE